MASGQTFSLRIASTFFFFWATLHITEGLIKTYLLARQADLLKPPEPKDTNTLALLPTPEPK